MPIFHAPGNLKLWLRSSSIPTIENLKIYKHVRWLFFIPLCHEPLALKRFRPSHRGGEDISLQGQVREARQGIPLGPNCTSCTIHISSAMPQWEAGKNYCVFLFVRLGVPWDHLGEWSKIGIERETSPHFSWDIMASAHAASQPIDQHNLAGDKLNHQTCWPPSLYQHKLKSLQIWTSYQVLCLTLLGKVQAKHDRSLNGFSRQFDVSQPLIHIWNTGPGRTTMLQPPESWLKP